MLSKNTNILKASIILSILLLANINCIQEKKDNTLKIGALLVLSGSDANYGVDSQRGIDLAVEQLNSNNGINGRKVKIIYEDTQGLPKHAVTGIQKLISQDQVPLVIGAIFSSNTLAVAPVAEQNKVVLLSPGSSNPQITNSGDYIFRNWISDTYEAIKMADFCMNEWKYTNIAILYIKNDYGQGLTNEFEKHFKESGGNITRIESYQQGEVDFRTQLTKISRTKPDAIYLPGYYNEIAQILNQSNELRIKTQFLSVVSFEDPKLIELAGKNAEGVIYSSPIYDINSPDSTTKHFVEAFRKKYNRDPGLFAAHGYDAMNIVAEAICKSGTKFDQIKDVLYAIKDFNGVSGLTTFDENGDVLKPVRLKVVKDGKFVNYEKHGKGD